MSETLVIQKYDEVYVKVKSEASTAYELSEHFTFSVPGAKFSPAFRNKVWDGKIRLFNVMTGLVYAGLVPYIENFAKERDYEVEYSGDFTQQEFSLKEAEDFIKTLDLPAQYQVRDYQLNAFARNSKFADSNVFVKRKKKRRLERIHTPFFTASLTRCRGHMQDKYWGRTTCRAHTALL